MHSRAGPMAGRQLGVLETGGGRLAVDAGVTVAAGPAAQVWPATDAEALIAAEKLAQAGGKTAGIGAKVEIGHPQIGTGRRPAGDGPGAGEDRPIAASQRVRGEGDRRTRAARTHDDQRVGPPGFAAKQTDLITGGERKCVHAGQGPESVGRAEAAVRIVAGGR